MRKPSILAALLTLSCRPDIPEGRFACSTNSDCPAPWICDNGLCYSSVRDAGIPIPDRCELSDGVYGGFCNDECVDTSSRVDHCGGCNVQCPDRDQATAECVTAVCQFNCLSGSYDCDGNPDNGCESNLADVANCGSCGDECEPFRGAATCDSMTCEIAQCDEGFGDCDSTVETGCEAPLDTLTHCGACNMTCGLPHAVSVCVASNCEIQSCESGWGDCDSLEPGCETSLTTTENCGTCVTSCGAGSAFCVVSASGALCQATCPAGTTDCDGSCVDTETNPLHCGRCSNPCPTRLHTTPVCAGGSCGGVCQMGWNDCDGDPATGCESDLRDNDHCGACNRPCLLGNATETCGSGTCEIAMCDTGFGDCDSNPSNGCETSLRTTTDCGMCETACVLPDASSMCDTGMCLVLACESGFGDCDAVASNGCETQFGTRSHCARCGDVCELPNASERCDGGLCVIMTCEPGFGNCDSLDDNGCETYLGTIMTCQIEF